MHKFKYIGGRARSEYANECEKVDERDGVDMPDSVTAFGHKFIVGQEVELKRSAFRSPKHYEHAIAKLKKHPHFEEVVIEDAEVEDIPAPKKKPGRKPKLPVADVLDGEVSAA